jgi:fructokinase
MGRAPPEVVGLGEVLWDLLPGGRQLGGAPFNFAFHCHQLGHPGAVVSRVGADAPGREIRDAVRRLGLSDAYLPDDPAHPTGTVTVAVGAGGQPSFTITPGVAYDFLEWQEPLADLFRQARAVCFGTLAQRHPAARATIQRALREAGGALVVYDVNLRQHYYDRGVIEASLRASRWAKLNEDELGVLRGLLGLAGDGDREALRDLRRRYDLELAALTRGERGCLVQSAEGEIDAPGVAVAVVDTVGAGDAFTAGLVAYALEGRPFAEGVAFANRLAARVAAAAGATPRIDRADLEAGRCSAPTRTGPGAG